MKVLVLGGDGMLGHQVVRQLAKSHDVVATLRKPASPSVRSALDSCRIVNAFDARVPEASAGLLLAERPQAVINCIGIVKQRAAALDPLESIAVNSLFPHRLAAECRLAGARLLHISTDCVFSGTRGDYREADPPDPTDIYGQTKLLGEVSGEGCLTIRTSMIGLELTNRSSLIEWFLSQEGSVRGYTRARWNGLTTAELARVIDRLLTDHTELQGVWHVSGEVISKYRLLLDLAALLGDRIAVVPVDGEVIDRSLNSELFRAEVAYDPPSWEQLLAELASAVRTREEGSLA
jgi:dTDP-4-dehydrorhamnose reductase